MPFGVINVITQVVEEGKKATPSQALLDESIYNTQSGDSLQAVTRSECIPNSLLMVAASWPVICLATMPNTSSTSFEFM